MPRTTPPAAPPGFMACGDAGCNRAWPVSARALDRLPEGWAALPYAERCCPSCGCENVIDLGKLRPAPETSDAQ